MFIGYNTSLFNLRLTSNQYNKFYLCLFFFLICNKYAGDRLFQYLIRLCMHLMSIISIEFKKKSAQLPIKTFMNGNHKCLVTVLGSYVIALHKQQNHVIINVEIWL